MEKIRRLYELEARTTIPSLNLTASTPTSTTPQNDRQIFAAIRNIKDRTSQQLMAHDRRITQLEQELKALTGTHSTNPAVLTTPDLDHNSDKKQTKKKKKKKKAAASKEE